MTPYLFAVRDKIVYFKRQKKNRKKEKIFFCDNDSALYVPEAINWNHPYTAAINA